MLLLGAVIGAVYAQATLSWGRNLTGVQPDLLPLIIVYAALVGEPLLLCLLALIGGLLLDSLSLNPLGSSMLSMLVVGLSVHGLRDVLMRDQLYARALVGGLASGLASLTSLVILLLSPQRPVLGWDAARVIMGQSLWGAALAPVVFWALGRLDRMFNHPQVAPGSFRPDREIRRGRN